MEVRSRNRESDWSPSPSQPTAQGVRGLWGDGADQQAAVQRSSGTLDVPTVRSSVLDYGGTGTEGVVKDTTVLREGLRSIMPESETQFRAIQKAGHRLRAKSGDEAWALYHEQTIREIRAGRQSGTSRIMRITHCLRCEPEGTLAALGANGTCPVCGWRRGSKVNP